MNIRKSFLGNIIPDAFVLVVVAITPILLTVLLYARQYTNAVYRDGQVSIAEIENNWVNRTLQQLPLVEVLNRIVDFAFWGFVGLLCFLIIWVVASVKVSVENHYATEDFVNFQEDKVSWHQRYVVVAILKGVLLAISAYSVVIILVRYIPRLSVEVGKMFVTSFPSSLVGVSKIAVIIWSYLMVTAIAIKTFKHLRSD